MNSQSKTAQNDSRIELTEAHAAYLVGENLPTIKAKHGKRELTDSAIRYFRALKQHYEETGNAYIAIEALVGMVRRGTSPPAWVLESVANVFSQHPDSPHPKELKYVTLLNGNEYKGYLKRSRRSFVMIDFAKLISTPFELSQEKAAELIISKYGLEGRSAKTLVNRWSDEWRGFYERLGVFPLPQMSAEEKQEFVNSFDESLRYALRTTPAKS